MADKKTLTPLAELVLVGEVVSQAKIAAFAAGKLAESSDSVEIWSSIQSILVAAGNVSKILWPARAPYKERGKQLRGLIRVDEKNVLCDRRIRNHFEHYDERVQDWFDENDSTTYMDSKIGPAEQYPWSFPPQYHRSYDPVSQVLSFRDDSINLASVLAALSEVREKCRHLALP